MIEQSVSTSRGDAAAALTRRGSSALGHVITTVIFRQHPCEKPRPYVARMHKTATEILRDRVRALMARRDWNQQTLAAKSGVSQSRIAYLLNYHDQNDRHPTTKIIEQFAVAFGVPAWELLRPEGCLATGVSEADPLDSELLATALAESADVFRKFNAMPTFQELAAAAVHMYDEVQTGIPMRRVAAQVARDLDQVRRGINLAAPTPPSGEGSKRGQGDQAATRGSKTRTR